MDPSFRPSPSSHPASPRPPLIPGAAPMQAPAQAPMQAAPRPVAQPTPMRPMQPMQAATQPVAQPMPAQAATQPVAQPMPAQAATVPEAPETPAAPIAPQASAVPAPEKGPKKPFPKKIAIFAGIGVVAIIAIFALVKLIGGGSGSKNSLLSVIYDENILIPIRKDGKYGYINLKGQEVIAPQFTSADTFTGNYAEVGLDDDRHTRALIDKKGEVKLKAELSSGFNYDAENDIWYSYENVYNGKLERLADDNVVLEYKNGFISWSDAENKKYGIMNTKGKITYTYTAENDDDHAYFVASEVSEDLKDTYCIVHHYTNIDRAQSAIVNCDSGKVIVDFQSDFISDEDDNVFEFNDKDYNTTRMIYIQGDKILYDTPHDIDVIFYGSYAKIYDNDEKEYDKRTKYLILASGEVQDKAPTTDTDPDINLSEWEKTTGFRKISCSNGYGLNKGDKAVIPCEWKNLNNPDMTLSDFLSSKGKEYVIAQKDNKSYVLNANNGKVVKEFNCNRFTFNDTSTFAYCSDNDSNKIHIYNLLTGATIDLDQPDGINYPIDTYPMYLTFETSDSFVYYNKDLKEFYTQAKEK